MRQKLIAGNWKMNGSRASVASLTTAIKDAAVANVENVEVAVFPAAIHLPAVCQILQGTDIKYGAQNFYYAESGAYTGEISAAMLQEFGCKYVLVGHSERRALFSENNDLIANKFVAAKSQGLVPVICVGETASQRKASRTEGVVTDQLDAIKNLAGDAAFVDCVIAYEPVWAIGTGLSATPRQAQQVHAFIREYLEACDQAAANNIQILYGGSVKPANAAELFTMPDIDGALVGGASLKAEDFLAICQSSR